MDLKFLEYKWFNLTLRFSKEENIREKWLYEIVSKHSSFNRAYHNLEHIIELCCLIEDFEKQLENPESLYFAAFFHDIVYFPGKTNNEIKSALLARKAMNELSVPEDITDKVTSIIRNTKDHFHIGSSESRDTLFFLDMDLSILGSHFDKYEEYYRQIRKEFICFPEKVYKNGRKKFLRSLLKRNFIFHTEPFRNKFEKQARENILLELKNYRRVWINV
ncbi:HD domain-containing protein [Leptobacterium flavescens]|uniref:HD domain-containing protein n=1 Tax=Leptobacterium flavescens TaxID=472055 RepID=A0A6P0UMB8_9FLAO|nr:HD domain-containing protein [Leptobacterium flavescens]NER14374.1 HD domain-containing protein [Leptobacterium flavescens]